MFQLLLKIDHKRGKDGSKETSQEIMIIIQARADVGLDLGGSGGRDKTW